MLGESGYIYLLKINGAYKIGSAKNLKTRTKRNFKKNPSSDLLHAYFVKNYQSVELQLHSYFKNQRLCENSEWFGLSDINLLQLQQIMAVELGAINQWGVKNEV